VVFLHIFDFFRIFNALTFCRHQRRKLRCGDDIFVFWVVSKGVCFTHGHARGPFVGVGQGHSKSTGAIRGLVFNNRGSFEHSKTTTVHGTPKCANPQTLSEIHAISFSGEFLSTLGHLHKVPKSAF
jgi:hypothetical protein